jgi:hypothetical protein
MEELYLVISAKDEQHNIVPRLTEEDALKTFDKLTPVCDMVTVVQVKNLKNFSISVYMNTNMYDATTTANSNSEVIKEYYTDKYTFKEHY